MRNTFFIALIVLITAFSCKTKDVVKSKTTLENALLWEISGKEIKEPSYIFGTIHMIPSESYFLPKGTLTAIQKSKEMYFEIDMAEMNDMSNIMGLVSKIFMKDNITLKDLLTAEEYKDVSAQFKKVGLPMMMLERIKPMILSVFASSDMQPTDISTGKLKSYEMEFFKLSQDNKMKTGGLETIDFQIGLFDSIPYKDQAKMLVEQMNASDTDNQEFKALIDLYRQQDIVQLFDKTSNSEGINENEDILISKRNKTWIPLIVNQSKKTPTFYAVGAGHLAGPNGVLTLLKQMGYKLKAIKE
jgi:uncharacterized protein